MLSKKWIRNAQTITYVGSKHGEIAVSRIIGDVSNMSIKRTSCILFLFICTRSLWIKRHLLTQNVMQISGKRSNCLRHHLGCYRDVRTPDVNTMLLYLCKTLNYLKDVIIHLLHIYTAPFIFFIFIKGWCNWWSFVHLHYFIYYFLWKSITTWWYVEFLKLLCKTSTI